MDTLLEVANKHSRLVRIGRQEASPPEDKENAVIKLLRGRTCPPEILNKVQEYLNTKDKDKDHDNQLLGMLNCCVNISTEILRANKHSEVVDYITKLEQALDNCIKSLDFILQAVSMGVK